MCGNGCESIYCVFDTVWAIISIAVWAIIGVVAVCIVCMFLHYMLTMLFNPVYRRFTGKNLKWYDRYLKIAKEDDFF